MNGQSMISAVGDDTIELVLTPEQLVELSQAADAAALEASVVVEPPYTPLSPSFPVALSPAPPVHDVPARHPQRWHQRPMAKMGASTLLFVGFIWWSGWQLAGEPQGRPQPRAAAATPMVAVIRQPAPVVAPLPPPVQIVNPFDKSEVFQFPAGTSTDESREKVAQILMQRARDRRSRWEHIRPELSLRTASLAPFRKGPGT